MLKGGCVVSMADILGCFKELCTDPDNVVQCDAMGMDEGHNKEPQDLPMVSLRNKV